MAGLPVTIRLLDPPLHEFLPKTEEEIAEVAAVMGVDEDKLRHRTDALHEFNPMLGHRGCRLAVSYPEIAEMQARAIFEAAVEAGRETGDPVVPEIMVPLVGMMKELDFVKARIDAVAAAVMEEAGARIDYLVGTMIELPRAAIRAHVIAEAAEFFSFGTNDLTQTTFGISRDDASSFLETYRHKGVIEQDPFVSLDIEGVGELVRMAAERQGHPLRHQARHLRQHGGDRHRSASARSGSTTSCSPFRVPIAARGGAGRGAQDRLEGAATPAQDGSSGAAAFPKPCLMRSACHNGAMSRIGGWGNVAIGRCRAAARSCSRTLPWVDGDRGHGRRLRYRRTGLGSSVPPRRRRGRSRRQIHRAAPQAERHKRRFWPKSRCQ